MSTHAPLAGRGALITGGGGGIGSASARLLVRDGASVTLMGRTEETLRKAVARLREDAAEGAELRYFVGDATDAESLSDALRCAAEPAGGLHMAVAVVGKGGEFTPLLMLDEQTFVERLRLNLVSAFLLIRQAAPPIAAAGGGSIVCISSDAARLAFPYLAGYTTAKAGLEALVRVAALELAPLQVRVNAVRPGLLRTELTEYLFEEPELLQQFLEQKPLGRLGSPEDVAAGVRFLAGPESGWMTGQSFGMEGGNELTRAPVLDGMARKRVGDAAFEAAMAGRPPEPADDS
ncbi:MAG: SDR family oxidoreductase [Proteobacteria bacterium]|nr:SDR family oxidoreductase [Pseudomonadota bacterium]